MAGMSITASCAWVGSAATVAHATTNKERKMRVTMNFSFIAGT
jgi:hypothetical protein